MGEELNRRTVAAKRLSGAISKAMCNLYRNNPTLQELVEAFGQLLDLKLHLEAGTATLSNQPWRTEVYPRYQGLFVRPRDPKDLGAGLEPAVGRWGIVPFFHKGPAAAWKFPTNNCRSEEMHAKPSFRDAVKAKRCIIPASDFSEWTGPKGKMTRHYIRRADGAPLFLAGLWASHAWEGERTDSYSMVMMETAEGEDMHPFHSRQPVVLDREGARTWLDLAADYRTVLKAPAAGTLAAEPPAPVAA